MVRQCIWISSRQTDSSPKFLLERSLCDLLQETLLDALFLSMYPGKHQRNIMRVSFYVSPNHPVHRSRYNESYAAFLTERNS